MKRVILLATRTTHGIEETFVIRNQKYFEALHEQREKNYSAAQVINALCGVRIKSI